MIITCFFVYFMYRNFLSCFYHPVLLFMLFLPVFYFSCLSFLSISSVLFSDLFLLFPCVWFLFFLFVFSVSQCKFPFLSSHCSPPHLITKYSLESMFTPKRTKYPKHYAKKIIKTVSTNTLNPSTIYKDPSHSQQPKPKITSMKLFSLA